MAAVPQQGEGANRHLDAFQAFEPSDEQKHAAGSISDLPACLAAVDRLENRQVDAGRDDTHPFGVGPVSRHQVHAFLGGRRDEEVRLLRDLTFHANTKRGLRAGSGRQGPVLDQSKRVRDVGPSPGQLRPEQARDLAGQPVVREEKVVGDAFTLREIHDLDGERRHLVVERVLVQPASGRQVDHSRQRGEVFDNGVLGRLLAGEDIGRDTSVAERAGDLAHVDVQAAVCVLAQRGRGRRMHRDDRDPPSGAVRGQAGVLSHGTPISRQASVAKRSRSRNERPANRNP